MGMSSLTVWGLTALTSRQVLDMNPNFSSTRVFSIYQWKSELLSNLGFFSSDLSLPVCAGFSGALYVFDFIDIHPGAMTVAKKKEVEEPGSVMKAFPQMIPEAVKTNDSFIPKAEIITIINSS
ncbi:hypothetical protein llap_10001 [Limosa lapponica baueri]|uniref:Uncharacterized protein n=1 Tax=Limosa lapponica baueri TaxID=1758121 RepID=A0A2I0U108_LIMLA|nr:hypothetical protein llap_10001 [Limosa lapponica baueri]